MLEKLVKSLVSYCNKDLVFQKPPRLFLKQDETNSTNPLGKTAHYQPGERIVTVYVSGRHPKDILRSIAHELVHHHQNERGDFDGCGPTEEGYAQNDEHLRNMEKEAYLKGNMLFRDWEDSCKKQMQMEEENKMKLSELKKIIKETIKNVVKEDWGGSTKKPGGASFIGDDDGYKQQSPGRNSTHRPLMTNTEGDKRHCMAKVGHMGYDYRQCLEARAQAREDARRARLEETDSEQQIEEETIDEAGCDSHGKREDKKSKKEKEKTDEGKAHAKCKNGCQCEPIKEGEEPEIDNTAIEEVDEPETIEESRVMTVEKEKALKENYMGEKRNRLFEKLTKKWTK